MSFRKDKAKTKAKIVWKKFFSENYDLALKSGLPVEYVRDQELFVDFLMHGYIDHHDDNINFVVDRMNEIEYSFFVKLIDKYFEAGYKDPGLMALLPKDVKKLEEKYPKSFEYRVININKKQVK